MAAGQSIAQSTLSSPYSAFGLGKLYEANNMRNNSMGKIGYGTRDYFSINSKNPASYTSFDSTSFVFEGSIKGNYTTMKTTDFREVYSYATLNNLIFGFPVTDWWRSSFGLLPFSGVGYNVIDSDVKENIGKVQYAYEGEGGLSEFYWGNAIRFGDHFSIGVNASYIFGTLENIQRISFPDSAHLIYTKFDHSLSVKDFKFDIGVQYYTTLKNDLDLIVGAVYSPKASLDADRDQLVRSYRGTVSGIDLVLDTVKMLQDEAGSVTLPAGYGVGFSLSRNNYWLVGVDYSFENWEAFRSFDESDSLVNSHTINFGGQVIPDANSLSYFKRVDYRLGFEYDISNLNIRGENLSGFGITFGIGLPLRGASIRGSRSMINIGAEYGRFGTLNNELIREEYFNFFIGISIYEWWFFKRKYN